MPVAPVYRRFAAVARKCRNCLLIGALDRPRSFAALPIALSDWSDIYRRLYSHNRFFLLTSFCLQKEVSAVSSPEGAHTALSRFSCFTSFLVKAERRLRSTPIANAIGGLPRCSAKHENGCGTQWLGRSADGMSAFPTPRRIHMPTHVFSCLLLFVFKKK